jgi:lipopolysaccharide export system protein LptC
LTVTPKNILIGSLLAIAISLSCWSIFISSHDSKIITTTALNQPDAFMENIVATVMNKLGKPSLKVETTKMIHYADGDTAVLYSPRVTVFRQSPQPWHISASYAKTKQGISEIQFWNNVIINHPADTDNPLTIMRTSALSIFPNQQVAKTNEPVVVTQPDATVHAVGMLANWDEGTVKLLSQAREEYVPSS